MRGPGPGQPDLVPAGASAALTAASGLGPVVASGGFGSLHEVPGHPELLVKVATGSAGGDNAQLRAEVANLQRLTDIGVPTAYRGLVHWQWADGVPRTGIDDRVDPGALSKAVLAAGKFAGQVPDPSQVALVNRRTVQDLELIRDLCTLHAINIEDIQVMIAADGSVRLIDPGEDRTDLSSARPADQKQIMRQFEKRIQHIIDAMRKIAARNDTP